ncbi:cell division protein FtsH [Candidatus Falkowbacteria bacterium HGW-Falkowbacteria-2]|uniref:ATP-dependent zinc metalloprotease FtsH n=1 Tax=Candidatus Falkowbacteria bacterium HGW-Falkowbacteria-2 TaxID=2013769 RepID=A0A2N2E058_9BACT|nr:MAG: cell division protein FtsH [Candidatus Falkowbacteria bacterium HGW-Falkowbacteria-2]
MKSLFKNFALFFLVFLVIAAIFSAFSQMNGTTKVGIETLISQIDQEQVSSMSVSGNEIEVTLKDGTTQTVQKETGESLSTLLSNFEISAEKLQGVAINVEEPSGFSYWLGAILPFALPLIIIGLLFFFMMRSAQGMNSKAMSFGQSNAKEFDLGNKEKITFADVAGAKEAKEELHEVVEFLRFPRKFIDLGARIPRGVLLLGGPGMGKTLLARAVAGEAGVPFFHMSGSEFVEMFVGVGASRVRSLFQKAKKQSPCIVFIDEIDAVGRRRGAGLGGSHDEREQTLNQILVEMDGFEVTQNVIVIAATNRPDVLDPALLRPGRFDRQVVIDRPDLKDREEILKVHVKKKPLAKEVDLKRIAERTPGFSGADLANLLNEAAILTAREDKKVIGMEELFSAIEKVMIGPERKSRIINDKEKKITAYHEAGHAVVAHFLPNSDPVQKVSIIARGQAGGYTLKVPTEDRYFQSKSDFVNDIAILLAGHLIEKEVFGEVTTGATSDLRRATSVARSLITDYGMSDVLGPRTFGQKEEMIFLGREIHEQRDYSEKIAEQIDHEIYSYISQASDKASAILKAQREKLEKVVAALLDKETLEKEEFEAIVGPASPSPALA